VHPRPALWLAAGLAAACSRPAPPAAADREGSTYDELHRQGVVFRRWTPALAGSVARDSPFERRCEVPGGVVVTRGATGIDYDALPLAGHLAVGLAPLEAIVQREAAAVFGGRVTRVLHLGSYACRSIHRLPQTASQHAFGNAVDVTGFVLEDGRRIRVVEDFVRKGRPARTRSGEFLRRTVAALAREATFPVVLTPDFDRDHHDHLHIEGVRPAKAP
jgi:hypothetical protein